MQEVAAKIGRAVAALHDGGIVHGDLTTSNMITRDGDGALVRRVLPLTRDVAAQLRRVGTVHSRARCGHDVVLSLSGAHRLWSVVQHVARGGQGGGPVRAGARHHERAFALQRPGARRRAVRSTAANADVLRRCVCHAWAQFEAILEEYRKRSKHWTATLQKFAEGARLRRWQASAECSRCIVLTHASPCAPQCACEAASAPWWASAAPALLCCTLRGLRQLL